MKKSFFCAIATGIFLSLFTFGCATRTNVHIKDMERYSTIPAYRVPVKFYIKNNKDISRHCVLNYPDLFTFDSREGLLITVEAPWSYQNPKVGHIGSAPFLTTLLSVYSLGVLPAIHNQDTHVNFGVKLYGINVTEKLQCEIFSLSNMGIAGLFIATRWLLPQGHATFYGNDVGISNIVIRMNEEYMDRYCRVLIHLLSTIPEEKIESLYFSQKTPPVKLLK